MPRVRVVIPTTERIELGEGDWIEIRRELSYGETLELSNSSRLDSGAIDLKDYYLTRAALWVVDWSFVDADNNPIAWDDGKDDERTALAILERRKTLLGSLDPQTGGEIQQAINDLEAKAQEGKAPKIEGTMETKEGVSPPPKTVGARSSS